MLLELARDESSTLPVPMPSSRDSLYRRVTLQNTFRLVEDLVAKGLLVDVTSQFYRTTGMEFIQYRRVYKVYDLAPGVRYLLTTNLLLN